MKQELSETIYQRWGTWFARPNGSYVPLSVDDGWFALIQKLLQDIENLQPTDEFKVIQVKEKFGGLRFYTSIASLEIDELILKAEKDSYKICEL